MHTIGRGKLKEIRVSAAALVDRKAGKVLLAQRPAGKNLAGKWEYPGGKIEAGESPAQALIRELREELNLTVSAENVLFFEHTTYRYEKFILNMDLFVIEKWQGTPTPSEGQEIVWTDIERLGKDLETYPMPPADIEITDRLRHFLSH